ncbi:MAG: Ldh family oxidoreductase [Pseudomonadota bacterium]
MADLVLPVDTLIERVAATFVAANTSETAAMSVARALVQAEVDGQKGHGLSRIESYAGQARSGKVDGHAEPVIAAPRPGALMVDVAHGFAYPAIDAALPRLADAVAATGIAAAGFNRSHHCGAVGWHCERMAARGLIALFFANTPKAVAPWGGTRPLFGTNPIAFAAPRTNGPPIVTDLALSKVARGKILTAAQAGEPIPDTWAVDTNGQPTTDAKAALSGTLMPIGDAKGAALALMVELLAAGLTGARFATETSSFFDADGPPPGVGHLMIAIDPDAFGGSGVVGDRIEAMAALFDDNGSARLPGATRATRRAAAQADGVSVPAHIARLLA